MDLDPSRFAHRLAGWADAVATTGLAPYSPDERVALFHDGVIYFTAKPGRRLRNFHPLGISDDQAQGAVFSAKKQRHGYSFLVMVAPNGMHLALNFLPASMNDPGNLNASGWLGVAIEHVDPITQVRACCAFVHQTSKIVVARAQVRTNYASCGDGIFQNWLPHFVAMFKRPRAAPGSPEQIWNSQITAPRTSCCENAFAGVVLHFFS